MNCLNCGTELSSKRAKTCSARCRVAMSRKANKPPAAAQAAIAFIDEVYQNWTNAIITADEAQAVLIPIHKAIGRARLGIQGDIRGQHWKPEKDDTEE